MTARTCLPTALTRQEYMSALTATREQPCSQQCKNCPTSREVSARENQTTNHHHRPPKGETHSQSHLDGHEWPQRGTVKRARSHPDPNNHPRRAEADGHNANRHECHKEQHESSSLGQELHFSREETRLLLDRRGAKSRRPNAGMQEV